jgi:hypothetical protein
VKARKSLAFFQEVTKKPKGDIPRRDIVARPLFDESSGSDLADEVLSGAQIRLAKFR